MLTKYKPVSKEVSLFTLKIRPLRVLFATFVILFLAYTVIWWLLNMPGESYEGPLDPLTRTQESIRSGLKSHLYAMAYKIGERNVRRPGSLDETKKYVVDKLESWGYSAEYHNYVYNRQHFSNVIAEIPGKEIRDEIVIVGGHYDSAKGTVGANDNASGVAVTLELARLLYKAKLRRTIRFLFFVNEEPPYFQGDGMGSLAYARSCRKNGDNIVAVLSMETMGYYRDEPNSQNYPISLLGLFYPSTGNFVAFVGNLSSRALVRESLSAFRESVRFPSEGIAAPQDIPGIGWSDHWSFWQMGYPGLMVTDTAPFRDPNYHRESDLPDNVDYTRLARVTDGLTRVLRKLSKDR